MNLQAKKKIVLLGMMTRIPVAGVVWQTMQYLVGFKRLGYDVYYVEDSGRWIYDPRINDKELKLQAENGGHPVIVEVKRGADGVWRGERDIVIK